jgi:hypothetical protein
MALLSSILGFSIFGLGARLGQLGIQKRNLLESAHASYLRTVASSMLTSCNCMLPRYACGTDPGGHIISMLAFGYLGYWAHRWDERASVLIAEKRAEITERRSQRIAQAEEASAAALAAAS